MSETTTTPTGPLLGAEPPAGGAAVKDSLTPAAPPAGTTPPADARDWLPDEFRADPTFKDIRDPGALAKSYKHAAGLVGLDKGQVLRIPPAEDEAAMGEVFNRLGRPETPDGYAFPELPAALVEGVEPAARAAFHKLGLSAAQAKGVMELYGGQLTAAEQSRMTRAAEVEAAVEADLKREWGDAFDDRLHAANRVIQEVGGKELASLMQTRMPDGTHLGNHPVLIKALAALAERTAEPNTLKGGSAGQAAPSYTPDQAQAEINRLRTDIEFHAARRDPKHAEHQKNADIWARLNQAAASGRSWVA
jgi:hypothetical protein